MITMHIAVEVSSIQCMAFAALLWSIKQRLIQLHESQCSDITTSFYDVPISG